MESQQQNHPPPINANEVLVHNQDGAHVVNNLGGGGIGVGNSKNMSGNTSNYMCRQSSTRWTPTTEQIRILKELYYNNGIRSPTADQIQRISARLRQYGKIEGKNVFYWFQNHKARERQKKRFTGIANDLHSPSVNINFPTISRSAAANPHHYIYNNNKHLYPNISPASAAPPPAPPGIPSSSSSACSSPAGVVGVAQIGNYGSLAMEKSFRDCSISQGETQSCGWIGVDPYSPTYHSFLEKRSKPFEHHETLEEDVEDEQAPEIETLPLFPMHGGNDFNSNNGFFNVNKSDSSAYYTGSWYRSAGDYPTGASRASLELSLNSYTGWSSMDLHN